MYGGLALSLHPLLATHNSFEKSRQIGEGSGFSDEFIWVVRCFLDDAKNVIPDGTADGKNSQF